MKRVGLESEYALAGGMTQNAAMVAALEAKLAAPLNLPLQGLGQLNGAFGAAMLGLRRVERLYAEGREIPPPGGEGLSDTTVHTARRWSVFIQSAKQPVPVGEHKWLHSTKDSKEGKEMSQGSKDVLARLSEEHVKHCCPW